MFQYEPWTPPPAPTREPKPGTGGVKAKPSIHEEQVHAAMADNGDRPAADAGWFQFVVQPFGTDPEDPYTNTTVAYNGKGTPELPANLLAHRNDIYRAVHRRDLEEMKLGRRGWASRVQQWRSAEGSAPDAFDEQVVATKSAPVHVAEFPVMIRVKVYRKKTR